MGIEPAIWRRIQMPADCTFWDLHVAIQDAMGWLDCHLHVFHVTDPITGQEELIGLPDDEGFLEEETVPGWERRVTQVLSVAHPRLEYEYDFGDDWQHAVVLEDVRPLVPQVRYPRCVGGERACPPEDSGGVFGYLDLLGALADPQHEEHAGYREWVGGNYDPERFDPHSVEFEDPQHRWNAVFGEGESARAEGPPRESVIEGEFTSEECRILLMTPFAPASPLILNTDHPDELFEQAPLVANSLCYLRLLAAREPLKLTQRGYLPRQFLHELFSAGALTETSLWFRVDQPPTREADSRPASLLHLAGDKSGLTRKQKGKLYLTRRGRSFAQGEGEGRAGALFKHLFQWHVTNYNWAAEDRLPESYLLQAGFWYGLYLLQQYGDEKRSSAFYSDRYLSAFPGLKEDFAVSWQGTPIESFSHACEKRLLSDFGSSFGLVLCEEADDVASSLSQVVWAGPLLRKVIQWRVKGEGEPAGRAVGGEVIASSEADGGRDVEGTANAVSKGGIQGEEVVTGVLAGPWQVDGMPDDDAPTVVGTAADTGEGRPEAIKSHREEKMGGIPPYDPAQAPHPDDWVALADDDRATLVREYHDAQEVERPNACLHATFHVVIETQLACADPPEVVQTMARLLSQGLDRHEALHAIGAELARMMHSVAHSPSDTPDATRAYIGGLKRLTAASWRARSE